MAGTNKFNLIDDIPKHRLIKICNAGSDTSIIDVPFIIDDGLSIQINSKYGQLWEGSSNNLMSLLSSSGVVPSGQFALQGLQIWNSTDPIKLSFTVHLEMDTNPLKEVVNPARLIMSKTLPSLANGTTLVGKGEQLIQQTFNLQLKTLIPPGPNLQTIVSEMTNGNTAKNTFDVIVGGWCKFKNMVFTKADPTFSKDVCYLDSKPYPVSAELSIEMNTIEIATTDMISRMLV